MLSEVEVAVIMMVVVAVGADREIVEKLGLDSLEFNFDDLVAAVCSLASDVVSVFSAIISLDACAAVGNTVLSEVAIVGVVEKMSAADKIGKWLYCRLGRILTASVSAISSTFVWAG